MRYVITSGTSLQEHVYQRDGAKSALEHAQSLIKRRDRNVQVFDEDGHKLSLTDLSRREAQENKAATH